MTNSAGFTPPNGEDHVAICLILKWAARESLGSRLHPRATEIIILPRCSPFGKPSPSPTLNSRRCLDQRSCSRGHLCTEQVHGR